MASGKDYDAFKGTWEHVKDENMDGFMKELGIGMAARLAAKGLKPRLMITENGGTWTIRSETSLRTTTIQFQPDVEYDDTTADGRDVKSIVRFKNGTWEHTTRDNNGKQWVAVRRINGDGQQQIDITCGSVKAHRIFKRAN